MASLFNRNFTENIIVKPSGIVNSNTKDELSTECCTLLVISFKFYLLALIKRIYLMKVGNGLFSKKPIKKGDVICLYTGILIDELEGLPCKSDIYVVVS